MCGTHLLWWKDGYISYLNVLRIEAFIKWKQNQLFLKICMDIVLILVKKEWKVESPKNYWRGVIFENVWNVWNGRKFDLKWVKCFIYLTNVILISSILIMIIIFYINASVNIPCNIRFYVYEKLNIINMIWNFSGIPRFQIHFLVLYKVKIDIHVYFFHLGNKCISNVNSVCKSDVFIIFKIGLSVWKRFQRPSNHANRQHTFIVTSLKTEKRRPLTLRRKENYRPI